MSMHLCECNQAKVLKETIDLQKQEIDELKRARKADLKKLDDLQALVSHI